MSNNNTILAIDAMMSALEISQAYGALIQKVKAEGREVSQSDLDELHEANKVKRAAWNDAASAALSRL